MDKTSVLKKIFARKEVRDYTYAGLFFLVSAIFTFFAIKPSISIAFSLKKEREDLRRVQQMYEAKIRQIIKLQTDMETIRDKTYLIDAAIPERPETRILIDNIKQAADLDNIPLKELKLSQVDLYNERENPGIKSIQMSMTTNADYPALSHFIENILAKRRLFMVKNLDISKTNTESTASAGLEFEVTIEGYYF
ncbi:MAG TPA: type 4a pilus biogenesis protein PilO [Patescibacteria group bacterium]|nr:type 4a pilus biogenesis protein PilO [Patescibacteria group bacterium]